MIVKFIVAEGKVYFGKPEDEWHADVARRHNIPLEKIEGGGRADLEAKRIFGRSTTFGPYNPDLVGKLLPDWHVDNPS